MSATLIEPHERTASTNATGFAAAHATAGERVPLNAAAIADAKKRVLSTLAPEGTATDHLHVKPARASTAHAQIKAESKTKFTSPAPDPEAIRQRALVKLQAVVLSQTSFEAATLAFCNELAKLTNAHRVSLGYMKKGHCEIAVTNNGDARKLDKGAAKLMTAAMDEALDQAHSVSAPEIAGSILINHANEGLRRLHQGMVISVPFLYNDRPEAAMLVELNGEDHQLQTRLAFVEDAVALFVPVLSLLRRDELGTLARIRSGWRRKFKKAASDEARWLRWVLCCAFVVAGLLLFIPFSHTVNSPARIEGAQMRAITAPAQGFIKTVLVRPGDLVRAEQPLAELADRDLQLERNKLISEIAQHDSTYVTAMARNDRAAMMVAQSKQGETRAQLGLVEQQLARGFLVSPIDGVVLEGDLTQQIGSPVERGQSLMTIAPKDRFRTIIELDERDVTWVKIGQTATLSLSALPWDSIELRIERIHPMANIRDGRNVFEVEASVKSASATLTAQQLRAGLRGVAKISIGEEAILNTYGRRAVENLQRLWWRWQP